MVALLAVSGLLVPGLGIAGLRISGLWLLVSGLRLGAAGLGLRVAESRLLGIPLLRMIVGAGPLVVTHSCLLVQHGKRVL